MQANKIHSPTTSARLPVPGFRVEKVGAPLYMCYMMLAFSNEWFLLVPMVVAFMSL